LEDDGAIELPALDEIDESVVARKPVRRTVFRSQKMMGATRYRGFDRIRPVNWCFTIVTACMITLPSLACLTVVPFDLAGWAGGILICLAYAFSLGITLRTLYMCATVEPGIIPKIRSKSVNY